MSIDDERRHRMHLWEQIREVASLHGVTPSKLREIGIYNGSQGVFFDKERTNAVFPGGITVSVLHTGRTYADEIADDGILYRYPDTHRAPSRDASEIAATKAAGTLELPIFVVMNGPTDGTREVRLAWVVDSDDTSKTFLILFGQDARKVRPVRIENDALEDFVLLPSRRTAGAGGVMRMARQQFKFEVMKRYGSECAVCTIAVDELLEAVHLAPRHVGGTDHPANGLVLCASHRRAFDADLFGIDPKGLVLHTKEEGPNASAMAISRQSLGHLRTKPHASALDWRWRAWGRDTRKLGHRFCLGLS